MSENLDYFNCVDFEDPGDVIKVVLPSLKLN